MRFTRPSAALLMVWLVSWTATAGAGESLDFARDIRPILSNSCFLCHGPDSAHREAELRLDTPEGLTAEREGRRPFAPGDPAASEALRRMTTDDPAERMPPADSGKSLTAEQIARVRSWVEQGARWSSHWSF